MNLQQFTADFNNISLMPIFEIEVVDNKTKEIDYITFNIVIKENEFVASHIALNEEEEKSNKIAFVSIEIDTDFSLDENLQELYSDCMEKILNSEFFTLD